MLLYFFDGKFPDIAVRKIAAPINIFFKFILLFKKLYGNIFTAAVSFIQKRAFKLIRENYVISP